LITNNYQQDKGEISIRSIILDEDDLLPAWLEFLETNYAIENYHFFVDVLKFRKTVKELANSIYEKYITKSAVEEVNLMWATREVRIKILKKKKKTDSNIKIRALKKQFWSQTSICGTTLRMRFC